MLTAAFSGVNKLETRLCQGRGLGSEWKLLPQPGLPGGWSEMSASLGWEELGWDSRVRCGSSNAE